MSETSIERIAQCKRTVPRTAGCIIAIQDQAHSTRSYKKQVLKDPNITNQKSYINS